jgi:hypothetical protein
VEGAVIDIKKRCSVVSMEPARVAKESRGTRGVLRGLNSIREELIMSEHSHRDHVRIHIDQRAHESPNPTTGSALYSLGGVAGGLDLYKEVEGDREDEFIENGLETVHIKADDHFHSGSPRFVTVIVNGRKKEVAGKILSFDQVVALAFNPVPVGPSVQLSVTYRRGPHKKPEGTLTEGETVSIKEEMIFDVTETNKS